MSMPNLKKQDDATVYRVFQPAEFRVVAGKFVGKAA